MKKEKEDDTKILEKITSLTLQAAKTGYMPREELGFSNEKMEAIYGQAFRLYNTGKFKEALQLFRMLTVLDAKDIKYCLGLAACLHMLKEYESASQAYILAGTLDADNPIPYFHCSDCYIKMHNKSGAIYCLEMAVKRAGNKTEYQLLKDRATLTIDSLHKELLQQAKRTK